MISKATRQRRILDIVNGQPIHSQDELGILLARHRIEVTQATLSRDIRELGLVKVRGCYRVAQENAAQATEIAVRRSFRQFVTDSGLSENIVMVKTGPGNAHAIGVLLDSARWPEVLGTVAGDDTVFILLKSGRLGKRVLKRIEDYRT